MREAYTAVVAGGIDLNVFCSRFSSMDQSRSAMKQCRKVYGKIFGRVPRVGEHSLVF